MKDLLLLALIGVCIQLFRVERQKAAELEQTKTALAEAQEQLRERPVPSRATAPLLLTQPLTSQPATSSALDKGWFQQRVDASRTTLDPAATTSSSRHRR